MKDSFIQRLEEIVGPDACGCSSAERYAYSSDASLYRAMPDAIVRPHNSEEVCRIVRLAAEHKIPIISRGSGSSLCGQTIAVRGGIIIDFQLMNRVKEIQLRDLYMVVEPGIIYDQINALLKPDRYFFPPAPSSGEVATIGGMIGCNASGMKAVKYGATRDYIMGMKAVFADGVERTLGTRTLKDASGYQLARLIVGSEGTLAIVTEVTLRITPLPAAKAAARAAFPSLEAAGQCVSDLISTPVIPSACEIMDNICIKAVNKAYNLGFPDVEAILLIEVDGHLEQIKEDIAKVTEICSKAGATEIAFTDDPKKANELFSKGRQQMIPALARYKEGSVTVMLADDMSVPMSQLPTAMRAFHDIAEKNGILIPTYGHAGDGNLHTKVLIDPNSRDQWLAAEKATAEIYDCVLSLGGSVTAEHGIAMAKAPFMRKERSGSLGLMKSIKNALDPDNIMNPGKLEDWEESIVSHLRYKAREEMGDGPQNRNLFPWHKEMDACTYCSYCKSVCPVFAQIKWDSSVARGQINLAYGLLYGDLTPDESVAERLYQCTMCMDCYRRCPTKIKVMDIIEGARAELVSRGFGKPAQRALAENVMKTGNIFAEEALAPRAGTTPVFIGCNYSQRPNLVRLFVNVLEKAGISPAISDEVCCGYPLKTLGFREEFEEQRGRFKERMKDQEVITFCPTCTMFLRDEYGMKARHVLEVLDEKIGSNGASLKPLELTATWHDPCHLSRGAKITDPPRRLLSRMGITVKEMPKNRNESNCCGGGGGILSSDEKLSDKIALTRAAQAVALGVDTIISACPTCELTLGKAARTLVEQGEPRLQVKSIFELLHKSLS